MSVATVLSDTREQKPYSFVDYPVDSREVTLQTGDYSLPEFCAYDEERDTYFPQLAVERKTGNDLVQSVTHGRSRFKAEIRRAAGWREELVVVIEEPRRVIENNNSFMQYRDVHPNQILGTIDSWERYYNVEFIFSGSRENAEERVFDYLISWLRAYGEL